MIGQDKLAYLAVGCVALYMVIAAKASGLTKRILAPVPGVGSDWRRRMSYQGRHWA